MKVDALAEENISLQRSITGSQFGSLQGKIAGVTMALHVMSSMNTISQERKTELLSGATELLDAGLREIEKMRVGVQ
jgi:hypothetical protein